MPDIAELGLSIDTRQLEQGAQAMDRLGTASEIVEKKVGSATTAVEKLGKASADAKGKTAEGAAAVDAVGEAGARVVQKVEAATTSIDAMGASATRIRTVFLGGSNTLDGFMGASMGVWRSSEAAAAGIDSLGAATERTWRKQADYNGAMNDTSRMMRQAADAARTLEESNHSLLVSLQREIDVFGMARGELERYRAAELGLGSAAQTKAAALGNSIDAMHREERAARDAAGAQDRAAAAGDRFIKTLQDQVATLGMTTQQLQTYRAAQLGVSDAAAPLINKLAETGEGAKKAGGHMEGFSFQSASAKRELLVLAHELSQGQFSRFGGSMMVLGEQTGAAGLLFSSTGLAVLGFAAALGTVAYAMIKGASSQREMNNALISTNNYAGVTSDKLNDLAHAATAVHGSIGEAKKVVTELAGTGKFTGDQIAYISDAVIALETATGESVKKTIKEFESLAVQSTGSTNRATEVITRATVKLDDTYHFLTLSVYEAIRALEKDGDAKGASAVATEAFAKATKDGAEQMIANLGSVARAWHGVKEAVGGAMDAIGSYGAKATPASDVKKYSFRLSEFDKGLADSNLRLGRAPDAITPELQATRTQIVLGLTDAVDKLNKADAVALAQGEVATKNSRAVHAAAMIHAEDIRLQKKGMGELAVALDAYQSNVDAIRAADPNSPLITPDAIAAGIAARTKAHTEQAKPKADQVENTELADQIKQYAKEAATAKAHYDALGKLDDMYLKGGELSVQRAYENKRDYALKTYEAEVDAYDLQISALQGHNNSTKAEAAKHQKELNEILGKRDAAEKAFFDASFTRDEEERLRQAATATAAADAANKEIASINAQVAAVEEQIRTYGMLPAAKTALAIADLEEQSAALAGFANSEKTIELNNRKVDSLKRLRAAQGIAQAQEAGTDVAKAKELLDILTAVDTAAQAAATGMAESFGAVGKAIGGLTTALTGYERTQAGVAAQLAASMKDAGGDPTKIAKAQAAAAQQGAQAQVKSYGDMASAAKGFFKENSAGYKVMETAEKAFRAYEMAMAVESMVKKIFFKEGEVAANIALNGVKLTGEAATTAASTGLAATEASAWGVTAVVKALASLPFPLNLAAGAATLAAVVAIGAKMFGGMGGSSVSLSEQRQAANGTGSVLGDSSAKSESIAHSLAIMEKNSGLGLAHTISMDSSLKQMVAGIGNLGSLLARSGITAAGAGATAGIATGSTPTLGKVGQGVLTGAATYGGAVLGGSIAGAMTMGTIGSSLTMMGAVAGPIGMAIGAAIGFVVSKLIKTSVSVKDSGITGAATSLGNVDSLGFDAQAYADINVKKKAFGISYSSKNSTQTAALSDEMNDQFTMIITSMGDTIRSAADVLGLGGDAFNAKLNTFVVDLGKISLKDLTGEEQQKALETAFSKMGDDMAKFGVAGLEQYRAVGEGYLETLARVANDQMQVNDVLTVLGKSFNTTGLGAVALSQSLIAAAGDLETLTGNTSYFVQNFLTEAERMAPITKSVNDAMGKLGVTGVTTVDQFKQLVLAQDLNTSAGQAMYAQLIALAEPFKTVADYAAELAGGLADVAKTASEIASERKDLQAQLDQLTLSALQLRAKERDAIDASNRALFDQVAARQDLATAYETESTAITGTIDRLTTFASAIKTFRDGLVLGGLSTLSPTEKAAEAQRQYSTMLAAARAGDATAQTGLTGAASAYLTASQAASGTAAQYARDYARVQADMAIMAANVGSQLTAAQAQQIALDKQVAGLITLNDSVKAGAATVAQAIASLGVLGVKQINGSHAGGLTSVPYDGYTAELHAGERVLTAFEARNYSAQSSSGSSDVVAAIDRLTEENRELRAELTAFKTQSQAENLAIAQSVGKVARLTQRFDDNGMLVRATTPIPTKEVAAA